MSDISAEQLAKRILECGVLEARQIQPALADAGGAENATFDDFVSVLLQQELLTNWQIQRLTEGHMKGYFCGKWKLLYFVGAGTFARVYRAVHSQTGDVKACKVLRQRHMADEATCEQFMREAKMVQQMRHPNIVPIYEVAEHQSRIYMVMDFVEGQNLRDYFKVHKKIPYLTSLKIARDIASGLAYAFERNITHRDMKLSNVLLSAKGQAKLVDFGLAAGGGDDSSGRPRSIDYAGLEKVSKARRDDKRSDLFFLGCMLYEMITGKAPLEQTTQRGKRMSADRFTTVVPITVHEPDLPDRLVIFVNRLMELDPNKRIQTPALALQEAETVIQSIESGNVQAYDAEKSEKVAAEYEQQLLMKEEGRGHKILLVESSTRLQDLLREKLKGLGYGVLITSDPARGLDRFDGWSDGEDRPVDCVIFGCVGLEREGLGAFHTFTTDRETSKIPAVLIVTDRLKRHVDPDMIKDNQAVFVMPLKFKKLKLALRKLLGINIPEPAKKSKQKVASASASSAKTELDKADSTDVE